MLLSSKSVDFVVTGCTSGQGMMLACNALPNVICGYTPTAIDAFLFGRINNGNAISIPLGLYSDFTRRIEIENIIESLFNQPLGEGYPKEQSDRKISDSNFVKELYKTSQKDILKVLKLIEPSVLKKILSKKNIIDYILKNSNKEILVKEIEKLKNSYLTT